MATKSAIKSSQRQSRAMFLRLSQWKPYAERPKTRQRIVKILHPRYEDEAQPVIDDIEARVMLYIQSTQAPRLVTPKAALMQLMGLKKSLDAVEKKITDNIRHSFPNIDPRHEWEHDRKAFEAYTTMLARNHKARDRAFQRAKMNPNPPSVEPALGPVLRYWIGEIDSRLAKGARDKRPPLGLLLRYLRHVYETRTGEKATAGGTWITKSGHEKKSQFVQFVVVCVEKPVKYDALIQAINRAFRAKS